jgi:hypothetical protein
MTASLRRLAFLTIIATAAISVFVASSDLLLAPAGTAPIGDNLLTAVRGSLPNYVGADPLSICCDNSLALGAPGLVCDCLNPLAPNGTVCIECQGLAAPSGKYVPNQSTGIEPTGVNGSCSTEVLLAGLCNLGQCGMQIDVGNCIGTYPQFTIQTIGMVEGKSLGAFAE